MPILENVSSPSLRRSDFVDQSQKTNSQGNMLMMTSNKRMVMIVKGYLEWRSEADAA